MILISASFLSKSISRKLTGHRLTQLLALAPQMSDDLKLADYPSSSIPFTLMSAFAIAISYADRCVVLLYRAPQSCKNFQLLPEQPINSFFIRSHSFLDMPVLLDQICQRLLYRWRRLSNGIPFLVVQCCLLSGLVTLSPKYSEENLLTNMEVRLLFSICMHNVNQTYCTLNTANVLYILGERLLVCAIIVWSICTALTPTAAQLGNVQVISVRVLLGAGEGEKSSCS